MKIVIITSFPFPDGKATANRVRVFAEEFVNTGYADEVKIFATSPTHGGTVNFFEKINVTSLHVPAIDKSKLLMRGMNELVVAFKLWSMARRAKADINIVTLPSAFLLLPIVIFPKRGKLVIDVRDAVWTYFKKDTFIKGFLGHLLGSLFSVAAKKADLVTVTNSSEATSVQLVADVRSILVANGISNAKFEELESIQPKTLQSKVNLTYIGNVGIAQELDILIEFAKFYYQNVVVNVVGDGAMLGILSRKCVDKSVSNLIFHGSVPSDKVSSYMLKTDVLFAQIGDNFKTAIPTKIFEYIASGRRVLLGLPEGPAKQIFGEFYGVEIFPSGNLERMKQSYEKLLIQEFGSDERMHNLSLLKSRYIREKTMVTFLSELKNL
jgi:glycosyltransferase involved in cell wall biosynthesis